ncbi:hypothetical protein Nepgr_033590 [Nepenthes gracilis]|uniref:Uncharacterized protein n=1 Tax=Nepenthes gracilis TaxID=150966 RepID=A0AAD3TM92_NEPGR|nr:hypothetical protein Nepgr_033590 [Nepenthes gracilis]
MESTGCWHKTALFGRFLEHQTNSVSNTKLIIYIFGLRAIKESHTWHPPSKKEQRHEERSGGGHFRISRNCTGEETKLQRPPPAKPGQSTSIGNR